MIALMKLAENDTHLHVMKRTKDKRCNVKGNARFNKSDHPKRCVNQCLAWISWFYRLQ